MRRLSFVVLALLTSYIGLHLALASRKALANPRDSGRREPWTTSRVVGKPEPPSPYSTQIAFPHIKFFEPLAMTSVRGTDLLLIAEKRGRIYAFRNDPDVAAAELVIDIGRTVYGVAAHPDFVKNGFIYVTYVLDPIASEPEGSRLSRFQVLDGEGLKADPETEKTLLIWPSGGHNGGCLTFGPDGFLYLATGDGSGIADGYKTGQDVTDLLASILRLDVDRADPGRAYAIPPDNPFVGMPGARGEIWAYGLRQVWKMEFDRATGDLWAGEVGQDLWEMVYLIERGGNYGWSVREGRHPFRPGRTEGPTPFQDPIVEQPHSDFRSITGGIVYHGSRLPQLTGAYVYGDYDTGRVWALRYEGGRVTANFELVDTPMRLVDICEDEGGDFFLLDYVGEIRRLVVNPKAGDTEAAKAFPRRLSDTGIFASTRNHEPAPGVIPYSVNSELWSDGAYKERFMAFPGRSRIERDAIHYPQPAPGSTPGWRFPDGTVLVKTFSLEMKPGDPTSRRRVETRLLHFEQLAGPETVGDQYWHGYSYVWNEDETDAELVDAVGLDRAYAVQRDGETSEQVWHFPSRAECTLCHTMAAKYVLGVNDLQINKEVVVDGRSVNQLEQLERLGVFTDPLPAPTNELLRLYDHTDAKVELARRARSYLHSNCSHCHRKWGGGNAEFQLLATLPLTQTGTLGVPPHHGAFGAVSPALIAPGSPEQSVVLRRMQITGLGRMPHIASSVVDEVGVGIIRDWIANLPSDARDATPAQGD